MSLSANNKTILENAVKAIHTRTFYAQYPEHPKPYGEEAPVKGKEAFEKMQNHQFEELKQLDHIGWGGEEVSPYTQQPLGIQYPLYKPEDLIHHAQQAMSLWRVLSVDERAEVLVDSLERIKNRFFEIAYATQHTTGQSFMMSFQASGPHANDRALEALALGWQELTRFPQNVMWEKPMGKDLIVKLEKTYHPIPRGISLAIGCSTFPTWNSVPGIYASLITGNPVIVKPHPKAVLPIAIVVAEIQNALSEKGYHVNTIQLAADTSADLITKKLAEHPAVKIIDYTGSSQFGNYVESLPNKTVFTEKAGVNSVILDSVADMKAVMQNLSFAVSLYSGQMCTAPQNFFIPETGVKVGDTIMSYDDVVTALKDSVSGLATHPKMGAGTLGAIQNENTVTRTHDAKNLGGKMLLESAVVANAEFANARTLSPSLMEVNASDKKIYENELFGPVAVVIKTKSTEESIQLAKEMAEQHGAITCAVYCTDEEKTNQIMREMESAFAPVSLNLVGPIWVNQHAAFSDFHVTGGNPAGNASFTDPSYITRRFVWVGHRKLV